jgi:hypothetical protein
MMHQEKYFGAFSVEARLVLFSIAALLPLSAVADGWTFELEPYALASSIEGDASVGRATGVNVDVDMSDILEVLELAGMLHFEAHSDNGWGIALDYGFMDLNADISGSRGGVVDADVHQGVLEALLVRRSEFRGGRLDVLGGFRWWDNDIDVAVDPAILPGTTEFSVKEDWIDLVLGVRWSRPINDQWTMQLRGDIGGLGLESDFTSTLSASFRYKMSRSVDLDLQYKATWVDYENGSRGNPGYFQYDTVTHGPIIGFIFNF